MVKKQDWRNVNQLSTFDIRWVNQIRSIDKVSDTHGLVLTNVSVRFPNGKDAPCNDNW